MEYGYPKDCCMGRGTLKIRPYFNRGDSLRVMLIGQDPRIRRQTERVKTVLMLDDPKSRLARWITKDVIGNEFHRFTLYATNLVKCVLDDMPSDKHNAESFLRPYFGACQTSVRNEIENFKPQVIISFGQPTLRLFRELLDVRDTLNCYVPTTCRKAFTGKPYKVSISGVEFDYFPSVHLSTANRHKVVYERPLGCLREYLLQRAEQ